MMSLEKQFKQLMTDTVTIAPFVSFDGYSKPSFGTTVSFTARVEWRTRIVKNRHGEEVVSTATTFLFGDSSAVGMRDKITLPDGTTPPIINMDRQSDQSGFYYTAIYT